MTWHPVASSADLIYRTTYHAQILGRELVAWRADDDTVNLWENRCLHRGSRLTLGLNDGAELMCRYHGWRYANRTAACTYIPAHPADAPARSVCNRTYPVAERYGLAWGSVEAQDAGAAGPPAVDLLEAGSPMPLRAVAVDAPPSTVADALAGYRFQPCAAVTERPGAAADWRSYRSPEGDWDVATVERDDLRITLRAADGDDETHLALWVQPVDAHRSVIRGVLDTRPPTAARLAVLRHHNHLLSRLRDRVEEQAAFEPMPEPIQVEIVPVSVELAGMPELGAGRQAPLRVRVARKWAAATDVAGFELEPVESSLPGFHAGAHIDVHLPNGLVRQYSLTNGPGESGCYRIGVKLEPESTGGSKCLHETVRTGDVLAVSVPRNNFTLSRASERTVLLAGGIGITPLLSMAQTLRQSDLVFELHVFVRDRRFLPFPELVASFGDAAVEHVGLTPPQTASEINRILGEHTESAQLYVCGPAPMIEAAIGVADGLGWPERSVHFEYFANPTEIDDSSAFDVALARSGLTLRVEPAQTVLQALRAHDIDMPSSCEQGACGTCLASVLEGEILHQDVYLSRSERAAGDRMLTCVSRATSDRLVLDL